MRPALVLLAAAIVVTKASSAFAQEGPPPANELPGYRVEKKTLESKALGEERRYLVAVPESYADKTEQRYPVVYVLDGAAQAVHTAQTAAKLSREGVMPEVIVIAIPNVSGGRERDYTPPGLRQDHERADSPEGRADVFLAFLRDELIPTVERAYRTTGPRTIAGNSRGGLFVLYSLMAEPALFDARLVHSAPVWREDDALVKRVDAFLAGAPAMQGHLFLSVGGAETENIRGGAERLAAVLAKKAPARLRWRLHVTPEAVHADNAAKATPAGFRHVFAPGRPTSSAPLPLQHEGRPVVGSPEA